MTKSKVAYVAALLATLAAAPLAAQPVTSTAPVPTAQGPVQGFSAAGINAYLGIPYAAPPVGSLRFVAPQPPASRGTTLQATQYSAYCPQGFSELGQGGGAEDCLYLNIQTPANATATSNLPVLFWIHGGGLSTGSGQEYDGSALVRTGNVVFVSFNYRLGLLGFLADPALSLENQQRGGPPVSGNYGLLDQHAALAWVIANIRNFGGNPGRIMVFGESAGGQSTIDMLLSPLSPIFQSAGIESGAYAHDYPTLAQAQQIETGQNAPALGCGGANDTTTCLRALPASTFVTVENAGGSGLSIGNPAIAPNVDGYVLPEQPYQALAAGNFRHVPVLDGSNHDEFRLFISECDLLDPGVCPLTASSYQALLTGEFGTEGTLATAAFQQYAPALYPSPNYAASAAITDDTFVCGSVLLDALLSHYVPVYSYEFNDINPPNIFLPPDPNLVLGNSHAIELPYLYPNFVNHVVNLGTAKFTPAQQQLSTSMQSYWTSFAKYGRPLAPRAAFWPSYSIAQHDRLRLVSPGPYTFGTIVSDHQCSFWMPYIFQYETFLPENTPY